MTMPRSIAGSLLLAFVLSSISLTVAADDTAPAQADPAPPTPQDAADRDSGTPLTAEELLDAVEQVDHTLDTLKATLIYQRIFALQGDMHTRQGSLYYERGAADGSVPADQISDAERRFSITFETLIVGDTLRSDTQRWAFDGEWLVEELAEDKQFTKRRLAPPGQRMDPFRVGQSTLIPLPIGQRKAEVLARYEAESAEPYEGIDDSHPLLAGLEQSLQLILRPREAFAETDKFTEIRLWYSAETFLPMASVAFDRSGDVSVVRLTQVRANTDREPALVDLSPPVGAGWQIRVEDRFATLEVVE